MPIKKVSVMRVSFDSISVDYSYQREPKPSRIKKIAKEFSEYHANMPILSERSSGVFFVIDGNHTVNARKLNGETEADCVVYSGMTIEEEAEFFKIHNTSFQKPSYREILKSRIASGDQEAVDYNNVFLDLGIKATYSNHDINYGVVCHGMLFKAFKSYGKDIYREGLSIAKDAFGIEYTFYKSEILEGIIRFVSVFKNDPNYTRKDFEKVLSSYTVNDFCKAERIYLPTRTGGSTKIGGRYMAMGMVDLYNKGKRTKKLDRSKVANS